MSQINRKQIRKRIHFRIRKKISGSAEVPRLAVHFSHKHACAQIIDDSEGKTLAYVSTQEKKMGSGNSINTKISEKVGELIAERAKKAKISKVVFDRGGFKYHGKVKALADAARKGGLEF